MKNYNLVPLLSYKYKLIGSIITVPVTLLLFLNIVFGLETIEFNYLLIIGNISLLMYNFSLERESNENQIIILYHTLKFVFLTFNSTIISFYIVTALFNISNVINILAILFIFNLFFSLHYKFVKKLHLKFDKETTLKENIKNQNYLYLTVAILSLLTLVFILII